MNISIGDTGELVIHVQQTLNENGFSLMVDGVFGRRTERAVKEFQASRGLVADGIVGPNTLAALNLQMNGADVLDPFSPVIDSAEGSDWSQLKSNIARIALEEWQLWHREDGSKITERNSLIVPRLQTYYVDGVQHHVTHADLQDKKFQLENPWSAVFISWVMKAAGAEEHFDYSRAHWRYVSAAKNNMERRAKQNPFWAFPIDMITPTIGDLVCKGRAGSNATFSNIDQPKKSHCDIVVKVDSGEIATIGGNVSNTVGKTVVKLDNKGFVSTVGGQRNYFAIVRTRNDSSDLSSL